MKELTHATTLEEFFLEKLGAALKTQNLSLSPQVQYYLIQLLTHFSLSENLFDTNSEGKPEYKALALKLYDAAFDAPERRPHHLKSVGDTALYHAGVFYEGLFNKAVGIDYYINIGGSAYMSLANLQTYREHTLADTFAELSERFAQLVEILNLICESEVANHDHDVLRLLDRYQKTKSQKAKNILKENGIDPDAIVTAPLSKLTN